MDALRRAIVVPVPPPVARSVDEIRRRHDPVMAARIDAHITLVHDVVDQRRAGELIARAAGRAPFTVHLTRAALWGRARYGVYLAVADPDGGLASLHAALREVESPAWARVEYRPHVTLVHGRTVTAEHAEQAWTALEGFVAGWEVKVSSIDVVELVEPRWVLVERVEMGVEMGSAMTDVQTPWYLAGNYGPVTDELTVLDLPVTGAIPPSLSGRYLRNGPNPANGTSSHWFFGDGMVHGVRLQGGRAVWYRNRWVRTTKLTTGLDATDPASMFDPTASAANTHVLAHAGRIWALEEGHLPYELSPQLDTIGCDDFGGRLTTAFTAHPKRCPETGELHFFGYGVLSPHLTYHVLSAEGRLVHSAAITVAKPTMMHDFMITREHAVFMDLPVVFDLDAVGRGEPPIRWDDSYGARVGILPRMGTDADVRWFDIEPCYVFHPLNAYGDGSKVVCDVGRHASLWRGSMDDFEPSFLYRWTFDMETGAVTETPLDDVSHSFPRVDDRVVGLRHRYGWAAAPRPGAGGGLDASGVVVKYDLQAGGSVRYDLGPSAHPGEFVFVGETDTGGEDDGWAMGMVYDAATDTSDLVILDASDASAEPVARVHLPRRVPYGFHGSWISDAELR